MAKVLTIANKTTSSDSPGYHLRVLPGYQQGELTSLLRRYLILVDFLTMLFFFSFNTVMKAT